MKLVCQCLNVQIEVQSANHLEKPDFHLTSEEKNHKFFCQKIHKISPEKYHVQTTFTRLMKSELIGSWNVWQCSLCKFYTYATNCANGMLACAASLHEDVRDFSNKPSNYSPAFQLIIPNKSKLLQDANVFNIDGNKDADQEFVKEITDKASSFLKLNEQKVENAIKMFIEKQKRGFQDLKRQVRQEQEAILYITMTKEEDKKDSLRDTTNIDRHQQPSDHCLDMKKTSSMKGSKENEVISPSVIYASDKSTECVTQLHFDSPLHDPLDEEFQRMQVTSPYTHSSNVSHPHESDGVFAMDYPIATLIDYEEDYNIDPLDSFDDSDDEKITGNQRSFGMSEEVARSVPISVPAWPSIANKLHMDKEPSDSRDIGASIKELANSVRESSQDVFGELPRPKLPKGAKPFLPQ